MAQRKRKRCAVCLSFKTLSSQRLISILEKKVKKFKRCIVKKLRNMVTKIVKHVMKARRKKSEGKKPVDYPFRKKKEGKQTLRL